MMKAARIRWIALAVLLVLLAATPLWSAKLKDIASFGGVRPNQLIGYGLVVGLNKTGDGNSMRATTVSIVNMLQSMGITIEQRDIKSGNCAAVMVTATLPAFARQGMRLDVTVSSIGDAKSLQGGTLVMCPLRGPDGKVYAVAQGPMSIGGFSAGGGGGASVTRNYPTVGSIPSGALVEREVLFEFNDLNEVTVALDVDDFSTAVDVAAKVNEVLQGDYARALDSRTVNVKVPAAFAGNVAYLLARIEGIDVSPQTTAHVVVNERTGTVVMGADVRISPVAIAHGNLHVMVTANPVVSQPAPMSGGQTVVTRQTNVTVEEGQANLFSLPAQSSIGDLVAALNAIGVTPRDLVAILQAIKAAGALQAQLDIM